jgi:hypothetical protein
LEVVAFVAVLNSIIDVETVSWEAFGMEGREKKCEKSVFLIL